MRVNERGKIIWSRRVNKELIRKLYESDAAGMPDEVLLDEVGTFLLQRCQDILYLDDFRAGFFRCPRCETAFEPGPEMAGDNAMRVCPDCGFSISREGMRESFRRRQLNPGGAVYAFRTFASDWPRASLPEQKMRAIDEVIHAFHYSLKEKPDLPTRAAGVNLIEGKLRDVELFLDELSEGRMDAVSEKFRRALRRNRALWETWRNRD